MTAGDAFLQLFCLRPEAVQAALEHETLAVPAKAKRFPSYRGWLELRVASHCDAQAS